MQVGSPPEHEPPLQPEKLEPEAAAAVSVTDVFTEKLAAHVAPQLIPGGLDVTEPEPVPFLETVKANTRSNVAVTDRIADIVTVQVSEDPVHEPLQPVKVDPDCGAAVRVTLVPLA